MRRPSSCSCLRAPGRCPRGPSLSTSPACASRTTGGTAPSTPCCGSTTCKIRCCTASPASWMRPTWCRRWPWSRWHRAWTCCAGACARSAPTTRWPWTGAPCSTTRCMPNWRGRPPVLRRRKEVRANQDLSAPRHTVPDWRDRSTENRGTAMKWVTRENANVDRIACPWLIKRFVDPDAEFLYVPADQVMAVAEREGAIPYDVPDVELGHVDGRCSFESIMRKYSLMEDKGLVELAKIVHAADVRDDIDTSPYGRGLKAIAYGFAYLHGTDDHTKIALESPMYDALYAFCQQQVAQEATS